MSIALGAALLLAAVATERRARPARRVRLADSVADPGPKQTADSQPASPQGYERLRSYDLGSFRAEVYRARPSQLDFAPAQLVVYDGDSRAVLKVEGLESTRRPWILLYDFRGHNGVQAPGSRTTGVYTQNLSGNGKPDIVIGQYSGGEHCCTTVTLAELDGESVRIVGHIEGLSGLPFEGLELRKLDRRPGWQLVAHRKYRTPCGLPDDAADVASVYAYSDGEFTVETPRYAVYFEALLRRNLARWARRDQRSLGLLSTLTFDYAGLGRAEESKRFLTVNLPQFVPRLEAAGVEPETCTAYLEALADQVAGEAMGSGHGSVRRPGRGSGGGSR